MALIRPIKSKGSNSLEFSTHLSGGSIALTVFDPATVKADWNSITIVASGVSSSGNHSFILRSINDTELANITTPGTYTYTKNQFSTPIGSIFAISGDTTDVTLNITVE